MKRKTLKTIPGLHLPTFTVSELEDLLETAREFNIGNMRFTHGNQLSVSGIEDSEIPLLVDRLKRFMKPLPDRGLTAIISCPGSGNCVHGKIDTTTIITHLRAMQFNKPLPAKCKIAVAGCTRCCTMPFVRDIGLIPESKGWKLIFGGNGGARPRIGDILADQLQETEAVDLVEKCLVLYQKHARKNQRTGRFIEEYGPERFKKELFDK